MSEKRKIVIVSGEHRHEIEVGGDIRKVTIWKLGDREKGWIPNKSHFDKFTELLKQALKDPEFHIIFHYGVECEQVEI